ncbi:hypothetical protein BD310DRAFT_114214 [Dichomitus squalens]|uniref:Uncharacterized protein n=1 Tax=Dichomitus squalens TaxID=114155 RepID=A0A4Q9PIL9_9APHY|nr:hypothetical protein BD310DRAFT_114214 [Dichomitus squalens]
MGLRRDEQATCHEKTCTPLSLGMHRSPRPSIYLRVLHNAWRVYVSSLSSRQNAWATVRDHVSVQDHNPPQTGDWSRPLTGTQTASAHHHAETPTSLRSARSVDALMAALLVVSGLPQPFRSVVQSERALIAFACGHARAKLRAYVMGPRLPARAGI